MAAVDDLYRQLRNQPSDPRVLAYYRAVFAPLIAEEHAKPATEWVKLRDGRELRLPSSVARRLRELGGTLEESL